tara:strand:+ start:1130 stop:1486 length:357 start_codon:yes stop_codon:yes gene_type:complete
VYIFFVVTFVIKPDLFLENLGVALTLKIMMGLLMLVNIYCLYSYPELLEKKKCKCSENPAQKFMKIFSFFYMAVLIFMFIYLMIYYVDHEYNDMEKNVRLKNRINNENLEGIMIVEKV